MQAGKILVAQHLGTYVIKLVGDVRLTLCTTIDDYFCAMFADSSFVGVVVDLTEAEGIDSTSLGLIAKLAIKAKNQFRNVPLVVSPKPDITRLLTSMGFDRVLDIRESAEDSVAVDLGELPAVNTDQEGIRKKIIEAHKVLMDLNEKNRAAFSDLVSTLEAC